MPKAKIICTLGPASERVNVLRKMLEAGMDVARFNFSHGSIDEHRRRLATLRKLNHSHVKTLGDLEGYRIRIGRLKDGKPIPAVKGHAIWLVAEDVLGQAREVPFSFWEPLTRIRPGNLVFIDDGRIVLKVAAAEKKRLKTKVIVGGPIGERKGVHLPGVQLHFKGLTEKDKTGIRFCVQQNFDMIAQSFVRNREDILALREYMDGAPCRVVAKIENKEGIRNLDGILEVSDGIMVARGDMGVAIPIYEVPFVQKMIIAKCNRAKKFVITATQMLDSMTENPMPTRAEVSDVTNAVLDGSDYLMLSGETAIGAYPAKTVDMMNKIIHFAKTHPY